MVTIWLNTKDCSSVEFFKICLMTESKTMTSTDKIFNVHRGKTRHHNIKQGVKGPTWW